MLKIILLVVAVAIMLIFILAFAKPAIFRVVRIADIKASPESIFALLNDFHRWQAWSPWERMDENLQREYSGSVSGAGMKYAWQGNKKVGKGNMEVVESQPSSMLKIQLNFIEPFVSSNIVVFTLVPQGETTQITWLMEGPYHFISKLISVFVDMDKMVGKNLEAGLNNMNEVLTKSTVN
ncbi:MAG: SRPBCC family protein [Pseudomonadota bacterium]